MTAASAQLQRRLAVRAASLFLFFSLAQLSSGEDFYITSHRAWLHLFPSSNGLTGIDTLSVHSATGARVPLHLRLLRSFTVESFTIDGHEQAVKHERDTITCGNLPGHSDFDIVVSYFGKLDFQSEFTRMDRDRAVLREEEILPSGFDSLGFVRIGITAPPNWETVTVGRLAERTAYADSSRSVWECAQRIPMIGWVCGGKFLLGGKGEARIPVRTLLFPEDSASSEMIANLSEKALSFYGLRFSPYRFPQLSLVEVDDWVGGKNVLALAAPSFILVKKMAFTTADTFNRVQSILPHEIAHQWWPVTVFINNDDAALLAEGLCEYSAKLFDDYSGTPTLRDSLGHHPLLRPLVSRISRGKDTPLHQKADLRTMPTQYLKASYVHSMLRNIIGDTAFFQLYREYARRYALKKAGEDDFQRLAEELSGRKLGWFFDQWVDKTGAPKLKLYDVKASRAGNEWQTRGRLRILGYEKHFTSRVDVAVKDSSGTHFATVWVGEDSAGAYHNDVPFTFTTARKPFRAYLDPRGDVLKIQKLAPKLGDLRDPSDGVMIVGGGGQNNHLLELARKDSSAMEVAGWTTHIKFDSSVTLSDLQNENVFLYGRASENVIVQQLEGKFPMRLRGDSVIIGGGAVFDSSLTLLQTIENPFSPQGLLCWIAPLSEIAQPLLLPYDDSWVLTRGREIISSGTWEASDQDLVVEIR